MLILVFSQPSLLFAIVLDGMCIVCHVFCSTNVFGANAVYLNQYFYRTIILTRQVFTVIDAVVCAHWQSASGKCLGLYSAV